MSRKQQNLKALRAGLTKSPKAELWVENKRSVSEGCRRPIGRARVGRKSTTGGECISEVPGSEAPRHGPHSRSLHFGGEGDTDQRPHWQRKLRGGCALLRGREAPGLRYQIRRGKARADGETRGAWPREEPVRRLRRGRRWLTGLRLRGEAAALRPLPAPRCSSSCLDLGLKEARGSP